MYHNSMEAPHEAHAEDIQLKQYDSVVAAKYLLAMAYEKGIALNITKVQKMLFIAYGVFLSKFNHVFIKEQPKAWPYGPVFPRTRNNIDFSKVIKLDDPSLVEISQDESVQSVFDDILKIFSKYSAGQLSEWSHADGSPWHKTTKQPGFDWNMPIPDEFIKVFFNQVLKKNG